MLAREDGAMRASEERVYTLEIGGRPVLCFPASNHREAQSLLKEEWLRDDLRQIKSGGAPLWDGQEKLLVRNADTVETGRYEREAKSLPAGDDLPIVYLVALY
jgi:hypothetical protein